MAKYAIDSTTLTGIANAIREKAKTSGAIATSKMAESILAIKGGLSVDVVTASSLPSAVVDGQIVVITNTTPSTVYIDTDEPANPVAGDVWIEVAAGGDAALVLTEESPYLRNGLTASNQWNGSEWEKCDGYIGEAGNWEQFAFALPPVGTPLNDMTWDDIARISEMRLARDYFSIGDAKQITINGQVGESAFNNTSVWAFIIGIYHDPVHEGGYFITFQIAKTAQAGGNNICLVDSKYDTTANASGCFCMNDNGRNDYGWEKCQMRTAILGSDHSPTEPLAGSLLAALPSDLRAVMRSVTKYTDNVGNGSSTAGHVTPTTESLFLPAEFEVFGAASNGNVNEKNYQQQYEYYSSGNSTVYYRHDTGATAVKWLCRSVNKQNSMRFCGVSVAGAATTFGADSIRGICPCFCV